MYKPREPFITTLELLNPTYSKVKGVIVKGNYVSEGFINCSFKSYGGTEITTNEVLAVEDTVTVETWYRPDITSSSRFKLQDKLYEVIGTPENISMRNQYLKFKVRGIRGGA